MVVRIKLVNMCGRVWQNVVGSFSGRKMRRSLYQMFDREATVATYIPVSTEQHASF